MKKHTILYLAVGLFLAVPVFGQHPEAHPGGAPRPMANSGHTPPPPEARADKRAKPEVERAEGGKVDRTAHVANDHWYGHPSPNDKRYHLAHPFPHGHFAHFGPSYHYSVARVDVGAHRFWFPGGFFFDVAPWEWSVCANWCWNCGDNFVVYEDPDHPGWYLVYDVQTGQYVHAQYMGS